MEILIMRALKRSPARNLILGAALFGIAAGFALVGQSAAQSEPRIGRKIEGFTLEDYRGRKRALSDWADSKLLVVAFLGTECPLANLYVPRMTELAAEFESKGVAFIGINSNQQDSMTEVAAHAQRHQIPFPILKDPGNTVADAFGAVRTPEVFVLDQDRVVRYWGRIDDQYGIGYQKAEANRNDVQVAVNELLAGKAVSQPANPAIGCLIGRVHRPEPSGEVTYSNQIAKILETRCVECHHEGQIAPFALTDYDEVVGWAEMMQEVIHERRMPPWLATPGHNEFKNNPSMTEEEIALIDRWIENGCPQGDPNLAPAEITYAEGWGISDPDEIFYMSDEPFTIPAEGVVDYQIYEVDPGFTEDRWIKEAEVKCGNAAVTHHVIVFIQQPGEPRFGAPQMAYAPGMTPRRFDEGMAIKVPAGSKLIFQNHYTPNGTEQTDRSYVGFVYADPSEVTHEVMGGTCGDLGFVIPPNDPNYHIEARKLFLRDATLLGMNPHMHVRGKSFKYELQLPDGTREVLLDVPRYDFNWQLWYMLKEPKHIPKGSRMICTAYFDNSADNPANPDPAKEVIWGEQTWDEMMFGFYSTIKPLKKAAIKTAKSP
jgi:peroxiredoxin